MGCKLFAGVCSAMAFATAVATTSVYAAPTTYEAESQPGVDASSIVSAEGFSGGKYVKPGSDGFTFKVKVEETAVYDFTTKVLIKQYDWFESKIAVNGTEAGSLLTKPRTCDSAFVITASAKMRAGENTITVGNGGALGVDYITVERHPDPEYKIGTAPVTPNATESARKVFSFLR